MITGSKGHMVWTEIGSFSQHYRLSVLMDFPFFSPVCCFFNEPSARVINGCVLRGAGGVWKERGWGGGAASCAAAVSTSQNRRQVGKKKKRVAASATIRSQLFFMQVFPPFFQTLFHGQFTHKCVEISLFFEVHKQAAVLKVIRCFRPTFLARLHFPTAQSLSFQQLQYHFPKRGYHRPCGFRVLIVELCLNSSWR